jgi:VWFA-related protein
MNTLMGTFRPILFVCLTLAVPVGGQDNTPALPNPPAGGQEHTIKVRVKEVIVPVTVLDSKGEMILDLTKDKFHVFDSGLEQEIGQFDLGGDPLAVALVVETSSHIKSMASIIRNMGGVFTETVMALDGEAALITYDSAVEVRQTFTQDHEAIERAIHKVDFEVPQMRLYDAMAAATELLKGQPPNFRRIMLIVGESQDYSSESKLGLILRDVQLANITIYAVGPSSTAADLRYGTNGTSRVPLPKSVPPTQTEAPPRAAIMHDARFDVLTPAIWLLTRGTNEIKNHQLEVAASATGGVHYRTLSSRSIQTALDKIGGEIHAQYILSFAPNADGAPGFHEIKVNVDRAKAIVRTRPGYFLDNGPDSSNPPDQLQ